MVKHKLIRNWIRMIGKYLYSVYGTVCNCQTIDYVNKLCQLCHVLSTDKIGSGNIVLFILKRENFFRGTFFPFTLKIK